MNKELARGTGANELLHRYAIEAACADERQSYDFGLYQTEELKRFKSTFGAWEVPVRSYYFEKFPTVAAEAKCHNAAKRAVQLSCDLRAPLGEPAHLTARRSGAPALLQKSDGSRLAPVNLYPSTVPLP